MKTVQAKLSRKIDRRLRFNKAFMNIVASRNASRMFWSFISCQEGFICQKRWKYATCLLPYTVATWFDYGHNKRRSIFVSSLTPRTMWPRAAAVGPARPRLPHLLAGEGFYRDSIDREAATAYVAASDYYNLSSHLRSTSIKRVRVRHGKTSQAVTLHVDKNLYLIPIACHVTVD